MKLILSLLLLASLTAIAFGQHHGRGHYGYYYGGYYGHRPHHGDGESYAPK